jgi:hypothetical protein
MQITENGDHLLRARERLQRAVASRDEVEISAAAYQVITAWVWRPGSEIASVHGRFSVVPLPGVWWRVTLDLGIVWDEIVCRVEQETPTVDLPSL